MATYTSYLNLEKPTTSETFNLLKMNQNWDKIDQGVSSLNSKTMYTEGDFTELHQSLVTQTSRIYVRNGIVTCSIAFKITEQVSAYNNLLTLPIKPSGETNIIFTSLNGTSVPGYINSTTGKLGVRANMPVSEWYATNFSFML